MMRLYKHDEGSAGGVGVGSGEVTGKGERIRA